MTNGNDHGRPPERSKRTEGQSPVAGHRIAGNSGACWHLRRRKGIFGPTHLGTRRTEAPITIGQ